MSSTRGIIITDQYLCQNICPRMTTSFAFSRRTCSRSSVRILPRCKGLWFEIEYVYEVEPEKADLDCNKYLAIDLGVDNFATCVSTGGTTFIIEGRGLKSFNRWWNKEKAKLQSVYDKQGIKMGKKMAWLLRKRKNVINNFMNQAVNYIVKSTRLRLVRSVGT